MLPSSGVGSKINKWILFRDKSQARPLLSPAASLSRLTTVSPISTAWAATSSSIKLYKQNAPNSGAKCLIFNFYFNDKVSKFHYCEIVDLSHYCPAISRGQHNCDDWQWAMLFYCLLAVFSMRTQWLCPVPIIKIAPSVLSCSRNDRRRTGHMLTAPRSVWWGQDNVETPLLIVSKFRTKT